MWKRTVTETGICLLNGDGYKVEAQFTRTVLWPFNTDTRKVYAVIHLESRLESLEKIIIRLFYVNVIIN